MDIDHPADYVRPDDFDKLTAASNDVDSSLGHVIGAAYILVDNARADHDAARKHDDGGTDDKLTWDDLGADFHDAWDAVERGPDNDDHRPALVNLARALNNLGIDGTTDQRTDDDQLRRLRDDVTDAHTRYNLKPNDDDAYRVLRAAREALVAALDAR